MILSGSELQAFQDFEKSGWEQAAVPYHQHWGLLSSQSVEPMLNAAKVVSGREVLDVATGAGYVAAAAYERGADAIGIDFSAAQVELANHTYPKVTFKEASAEALPFEADTFDAVVMGFGMNHLPNPEAAIREAHRVLKVGGWIAFTVWAEPKEGEGFGIVLSAIEKHGVPDIKLPPAPPYFRFADPEESGRVLADAGFVQVETKIVPQHWHHSSANLVFDAFNEGAVRATAMLRSQPADVREIIRLAVQTEVQKLKQDEQYVVSVPAALSSGRKI